MHEKMKFYILGCLIIMMMGIYFIKENKEEVSLQVSTIEATVLKVSEEEITIQDKNQIIYTFPKKDEKMKPDIGDIIVIKYAGLLNKNKERQEAAIINYQITPTSQDEEDNGIYLGEDGIFANFYTLAKNKLKSLSLDEKIGQLFLVRYPDDNAVQILNDYSLGGFIFYEKDFENKTEAEVKDMISNLQENSKIPLLTAVDEEGGKVVRVSSNPQLVDAPFKSSQELYNLGGFNRIKQDTIKKSELLTNLGLNLNLAPVVDVSTDKTSYIYERTLGQNTTLTSTYAKTVIEASKATKVSYTLKHFPGYGNNADTHLGTATDNRTYDEILENDLPPFKEGINAGAEAVLISHNIVTSIDATNPASLSASIHNLLRNNLGFTGITITDNLDMNAVSSIPNVTVKAVLAGNDLIITTDYQTSIKSIKQALQDGILSENIIDVLVTRILAWKYYKGLMIENQK